MDRRRALAELCAALRGAPSMDADWMAVLWLANTSLVTPQILRAAEAAGTVERLPPDALPFLREVQTRNRERNRRLFRQLADTVAALNTAGIEPVLLKGAALWATLGRPAAFDRMLNDLDLLVRPEDVPGALAALQTAGFELHQRHEGPEVHVVAELGRPTDVGFVDLHQRAPGPPGAAAIADLAASCRRVTWDGLSALAPTPAMQVFQLVLHDQFHDGDYWRGAFDLRHLLDIADLAASATAPDWDALEALARTPLIRRAINVQLIAARELADATVPAALLRDSWARLQHRRRMAQFEHPRLSLPLALLGGLADAAALVTHRAVNRADRRRLFGRTRADVSIAERLDRLRCLAAGMAAGKL